jgi:mannose/fructose/N-acetylgalactosamine-specific phosphotransferase system component IIC
LYIFFIGFASVALFCCAPDAHKASALATALIVLQLPTSNRASKKVSSLLSDKL